MINYICPRTTPTAVAWTLGKIYVRCLRWSLLFDGVILVILPGIIFIATTAVNTWVLNRKPFPMCKKNGFVQTIQGIFDKIL